MQEALRPMLFADEMIAEQKANRDPVAPAVQSKAARRKASTKRLEDGTVVHSFRTLLDELDRGRRSTCQSLDLGDRAPTFEITTARSPPQQWVLDLLEGIECTQ